VTEAAEQDKYMPDFMESEYFGKGIGFFNGIDNSPGAVR
jgi:hypothetical protein